MKSSPSIVLALALSATAAMAADERSAANQRTQNSVTDPTWLTLDRIFDSDEFRERGLGEYKWSKRTASYFTLDAPQTGGKRRDLVRNDAATGRKEIVVPVIRSAAAALPAHATGCGSSIGRLEIVDGAPTICHGPASAAPMETRLPPWVKSRQTACSL